MPTIAVVDYGLEDLSLLETAVEEAGAEVFPSSDADAIVGADGIVLAGKAAFADAIAALRKRNLEQHIKAAIVAKKPFLGINVGMHMMFAVGREITPGHIGDHVVDGMNLRPGSCPPLPEADTYGFSFDLPHKGMAAILKDQRCRTKLLENIEDGSEFFFDHSFAAPTGPWVQAWTTYSNTFPAVVDFYGTCYGVQFHPENSGKAGMQLLHNFVALCAEAEENELVFAEGPAF